MQNVHSRRVECTPSKARIATTLSDGARPINALAEHSLAMSIGAGNKHKTMHYDTKVVQSSSANSMFENFLAASIRSSEHNNYDIQINNIYMQVRQIFTVLALKLSQSSSRVLQTEYQI